MNNQEQPTLKRGMQVRATLLDGKVIEGKFLQEYQLQGQPYGSIEVDPKHQFGVEIGKIVRLSGSTRREKAQQLIAQINEQIKEIEDNLPNVSVKRAVLNKRKIQGLQERIEKWRKFL